MLTDKGYSSGSPAYHSSASDCRIHHEAVSPSFPTPAGVVEPPRLVSLSCLIAIVCAPHDKAA